MMCFSYLCKHLTGSRPTKGNETGNRSCTKKHDTGDFCTPDCEENVADAKKTCRDADFIKIPGMKKKF
ncbi:MAG: hypothetical protein WCJ47_11095 [Methanomicrobiales archaeon]